MSLEDEIRKIEAEAKERIEQARKRFEEPLREERKKVRAQIAEVEREARQKVSDLQKKLSDIDAQLGIQRRGTSSRRSTAGTRGKADPDAVLSFVRSNPDTNASAVAEGVGVSPATARKVIHELEKDKKLKITGERRGTKINVA